MKTLAFIRSPEREPELFARDEAGTQVIIKLTFGQICQLALDSVKALTFMRNR